MKHPAPIHPPEGQSKTKPPRCHFRLVQPYSTLAGAKAALDNGGRFWNLFTKAGDNKVSKAELAKAAGVFMNEAACFLFFDMALAKLDAADKAQVVALLAPKHAKLYRICGPRHLPPAEAAQLAAGSLLITEGVPKFQQQITILQAGVIMVGKVMVPVTHRWPHDLYEVTDSRSGSASGLRLAIRQNAIRLEETPTRFGGHTAVQRVQSGTGETKELLFMPSYHTPLA